MESYSINAVSKMLNLSKATLRYYDQIGLVVPNRADNQYRYYSDADVLDLQYTEVMKHTGFELKEIKQVLTFKKERNIDNYPALMETLAGKKKALLTRIDLYKSMICFLDKTDELMQKKKSMDDIVMIDDLIQKVHGAISKGETNE